MLQGDPVFGRIRRLGGCLPTEDPSPIRDSAIRALVGTDAGVGWTVPSNDGEFLIFGGVTLPLAG